MNYQFGFMDSVMLQLSGTDMECVPHFAIMLKEDVEEDRLKKALNVALDYHKVFGTKLAHGRKYYLAENNSEIIVFNLNSTQGTNNSEAREFGKATNGYLWRVSYKGKELDFDICHGLTDGQGMTKFVISVLEAYYGLDISYQPEKDSDPFRELYNKEIQSYPVKKQEKGFDPKELSHVGVKEAAKLHYISVKTQDLLNAAKKIDTTPAALLLPLISKSIRECLPQNAKNRNVNFSVTADFRKLMGIECCRNFIGQFPITYIDRFDQLDVETLGTVYRAMMDLYLQPENVIKYCTDMIDELSPIVDKLPRQLQHFILKKAAPSSRGETNGYLTYIGRFICSDSLIEHIEDIHVMLYPDNGYCALCALDFNGIMKISFANCYKTDEIIPNFIRILEDNQITAIVEDKGEYRQAKLKI